MSSPPGLPPYIVTFGPQANCTLEICPIQYSLYGYRPSLAANSSFIGLFGLAGLVHIWLGIQSKTWFFMGAMCVGCVSALLGYVGRVIMYYNPFNFNAFMLQIILVTTTPIYFCAAIYVTLALTINEFSPRLARFPPRYIYWVFINCDVVSLVLQAAGGGLSTSTSGKSQIGVDLALAGLAFQVFTICVFCALLGDYLFRYSRSGLLAANSLHGRFLIFFAFLVITILMITIRCVYRLAELHAGYSGDLIQDETLFIWFEGFLILASVYAMMLGHPGLVFQTRKKEGVEPQRSQDPEL